MDPSEIEELMDPSEIEENFSIGRETKFHGGMCKIPSLIVGKVLEIFPFIEASRLRSKSGIQSLVHYMLLLIKQKASFSIAWNAASLFDDSILMKFERARSSLLDSLARVENLFPLLLCSCNEEMRGTEEEGAEILAKKKRTAKEIESAVLVLGSWTLQSHRILGNDGAAG